MGKIFDYHDILDNRVPQPEDFSKAKEELRELMVAKALGGEIFGGMVYGSVAKGTPGPRSDFDFVLIHDTEEQYRNVLPRIEAIGRKNKINIETLAILTSFASRGMHTIDPQFFLHLNGVDGQENIFGRNPLSVLTPVSQEYVAVHDRYMAKKYDRLKVGLGSKEPLDRRRVLQRALESPIAVGRRTLQTLDSMGYQNEIPTDDSKAQVEEKFKHMFDGFGIDKQFAKLITYDRAYSQLLEDAIEGGIGEQEYNEGVSQLFSEALPLSIEFTGNTYRLFRRIAEHQKTIEGQLGRTAERL